MKEGNHLDVANKILPPLAQRASVSDETHIEESKSKRGEGRVFL